MIHGCHMPSYGGTTANYADLPPAHAPPTIIGEGNVTHMVTVFGIILYRIQHTVVIGHVGKLDFGCELCFLWLCNLMWIC
jgi:hypothetical protein